MAEGTRNSRFTYFICGMSKGRGRSFAAAVSGMGAVELAPGCRGSADGRNGRDVLGHLFLLPCCGSVGIKGW